MRNPPSQPGQSLAKISSALLLLDVFAIAICLVAVFYYTGFHANSLGYLLNESAFPAAVYVIWALGLFGTVGAIAAMALYGYRERWFWRCMVIAAVGWLVFPPIHSVLGLIALIVLLNSRRRFVAAV